MSSSVPRRARVNPSGERSSLTRRDLLAGTAIGIAAAAGSPGFARAAGPQGQLTWGIHVSLSPTWFDPADTTALITPYMMLYAMHDALVKPMPGNPIAPCLAESFTASEDGLHYEFVLRQGVKFHNGEPVTAEDVKFSYQRYRGASKDLMADRVASIETPDPRRVKFTLKEPWPDFLTFYGSATGSGWVVPKKYVEKVGDEGFKKHPIGAGPYKFVSFTPGVELVLEANEGFWRKTPTVKRLVWKVIQEESTRLAALKRGEIDIVYSIRGELAEELRSTPGLTLKPVYPPAPFWLYFADQWDQKSPWRDARVRKAAALSIDYESINKALTLGYSKLTGSMFPDTFDFYWKPPPPVHDLAKAKQLLTDAGHPNGFDGGLYYCDASYSNLAEAVINNLGEVGIRVKLMPIERAGFLKGASEKKYRNLIQLGSGAFGNAATRIAAFAAKGGAYVYGSYPDIDELFGKQAIELDRKKREATLHKIQEMIYERTLSAPIWQLAFINGYGPRVGESGFGLIPGFAYTGPYEDITIKGS
jgi:peptide/nickel transport system substrate-binding protein